MPRRVEHNLDPNLLHIGQTGEPALDVGLENIAHAAAWRGQGHFHFHKIPADFGHGRDGTAVHEAEINNVHRNFRIKDGSQLIENKLLAEGSRTGRVVRSYLREPERIGVPRVYSISSSRAQADAVATTEQLQDSNGGAGSQIRGCATGNRYGFAVAFQSDELVLGHKIHRQPLRSFR